MPTVQECIEQGSLVPIPGKLRGHQLPMRCLLATVRAVKWMKEELPNLVSDGYVSGAARPIEQAAVLFNEFVSGADLSPPLPGEMRQPSHGVWEVRTDDLRFFGWFPQRGTFVISAVGTKQACMNGDLYRGFRNQARQDRLTIGLLNGAYMTGELDDVL